MTNKLIKHFRNFSLKFAFENMHTVSSGLLLHYYVLVLHMMHYIALILLFSGKRRKLKGSPKSKLGPHRKFKIVWESGILVFSMLKESLI